jgi:transposase
VSDLPQATERAFFDCQLDEDALHTTAVASALGNTYVRPYLKGQKNDFCDAEAIAEAVQRPTMKFVATKTAEQLDRPPPRREQWARVAESLTSKPGIREQSADFVAEVRCKIFWWVIPSL